MWPFDKEKENSKPASSADPAGRVRELSSQGLSEAEIVGRMEKEGYTSDEVDFAIKDALKSAVSRESSRGFMPPRERLAPDMPPSPNERPAGPPRPPQPPELESQPHDLGEPGQGDEWSEPEEFPEPPPSAGARQSGMPQPPFSFGGMGGEAPKGQGRMPDETDQDLDYPEDDDISVLERKRMSHEQRMQEVEEIVEGVVEEKWDMMRGELSQINASLGSLDSRVNSLEQSLEKLQSEKKTEVQQIEEKIDTYKESMSEVAGRMEAMESAIKDSLNPMMNSLRSLNDTVKSLKK